MRPSTARYACGQPRQGQSGDAQPFHREDAFRPTASKRLSCQTLAGSHADELPECHAVASRWSVLVPPPERLRENAVPCSFHEEASHCRSRTACALAGNWKEVVLPRKNPVATNRGCSKISESALSTLSAWSTESRMPCHFQQACPFSQSLSTVEARTKKA
jgi:hypothetical protein